MTKDTEPLSLRRIQTNPKTVLDDYASLLSFFHLETLLAPPSCTLVCVDMGGYSFFPAASAPPWQLEGVLRAMIKCGLNKDSVSVYFSNLSGRLPKAYTEILNRYDVSRIRNISNLAKGKAHIVFLTTVKTHLFHVISGSLIGLAGLIEDRLSSFTMTPDEIWRGYKKLREKISGLLIVMDGTFSGDGPGPMCLRVFEKNIIWAGTDPLALDRAVLHMMGFDPKTVPYMVHGERLGEGGADTSETVKAEGASFRFHHVGSGLSKKLYRTGSRYLFGDPATGDSQRARNLVSLVYGFYAHFGWFPKTGKRRKRMAFSAEWGKLLSEYGVSLTS